MTTHQVRLTAIFHSSTSSKFEFYWEALVTADCVVVGLNLPMKSVYSTSNGVSLFPTRSDVSHYITCKSLSVTCDRSV